jgi:DNA polymerase-3 subunit beta
VKVTCAREALNLAFQTASSVVPQRSTIPALQNVKLTARCGAQGGSLEVVGTDLEIGVRYTVGEFPAGDKPIPVEVAEEGTLVLSATRVAGLLRESRDETVTLHSDGNLATLQFKDSRYKIVGIDPADFPDLPSFEAKGAVRVETAELAAMVRRTLFATSAEITRYALTGVLVELKEKELRLVASDGKRMALARRKAPGAAKSFRAIAPPKALQLLVQVLGEEDAHADFHVEENQIKIQTRRAMIFARLIEGNYPNYEEVIPKNADKQVEIPVAALHSGMRRASLMTSDKGKAVKLVLGKNRLKLETRAQEIGESEIEIPVKYAGEAMDIIFNPDFFLDFLRVVEGETLELRLKDRNTAAVLKPAGDDYTYLVMPLKVDL